MFTGIIEEIGEVVRVESTGDSAVLSLSARTVAESISRGASIAVNGVCLTVRQRARLGSPRANWPST